jgi:hypothetical protein
MSEVERSKSDEKMHKAFANVQISTEQALERAYLSLRALELLDK